MCSCYAMCSWLNDWRYMSLMSIYDTWIESWLYWMIEIYVVDENIWYLDGEMRDGLVMLDLLMCIEVICVHMNVGLELMWWLFDLIVHCGVIMFDEQCVLVMQCICAFGWRLEVYVVNESMQCLKREKGFVIFGGSYTWKEFVQIWLMELKWDDDYMLLLCIVKGW